MNQSRATLSALIAVCMAVMGLGAAPASAVADGSGGVFRTVTPFRLAYTSDGTGGYDTPIGAGWTRPYSVLGKGGIPTVDVAAVVVDIAVYDATANSSFRLWSTDQAMPSQAVLQFGPDMDRSNTVIVPVGGSGKISLWNQSGSAKYNIDVQGYFTKASTTAEPGGFVPLTTPSRVVDSGTQGISDKNLVPGRNYDVAITNGVIPATATSVFANVKVGGGGGADGGIQIGAGGTTIPSGPPAVNFQGWGWTDSGMTIKLSADGKIRVRNVTSGSTPYIYIDVQGYFSGDPDAGGTFTPLAQNSLASLTVPAYGSTLVTPEGIAGVPSDGSAGTIVATVTASNWDASGGVKVFAADQEATAFTNVAFNSSMDPTVGASTTSLINTSDDTGEFAIKNQSGAPVNVRITTQGYFIRVGESLDAIAKYDVEGKAVTEAEIAGGVTFTLPTPEGGSTIATDGTTVQLRDAQNSLLGTYSVAAVDSGGTALTPEATLAGNEMRVTVATDSNTVFPVAVFPGFSADMTPDVIDEDLDQEPAIARAKTYKAGCKSASWKQKYALGYTFYGLNFGARWCWTAGSRSSAHNKKITGFADPWANFPADVSGGKGPTNSSGIPISESWVDSNGSTNVYWSFRSRQCLIKSNICGPWFNHRIRVKLYAGGGTEIVSRS